MLGNDLKVSFAFTIVLIVTRGPFHQYIAVTAHNFALQIEDVKFSRLNTETINLDLRDFFFMCLLCNDTYERAHG